MADANTTRSRLLLKGIALSRGTAEGQVLAIDRDGILPRFSRIPQESAESEIERFKSAVAQYCDDLTDPDTRSSEHSDVHELTELLTVRRMLLSSPSFQRAVEDAIRVMFVDAVTAVEKVRLDHRDRSRRISDDRFAEKQLDLDDAVADLLAILDPSDSRAFPDLAGRVVVCDTLRPLDLLSHPNRRPAAIVTLDGGWTSHASIVARQMNIPMVTGIDARAGGIVDDAWLRVDGDAGTVELIRPPASVGPDKASTIHFDPIGTITRSTSDVLDTVVTADGRTITLWCNADISHSLSPVTVRGAGVGLFRSEFLIKDHGKIPTEDEQVSYYSSIIQNANGRRVNIRTFDLDAHELSFAGLAPETNPALGLRGIRSSLRYPEVFRSQIRAMIRAARESPLTIVLPMITAVSEIRQAKELIETEKRSLSAQGISVSAPQIGAMIEVPSAVLNADAIIREVDLLCLGTNDLVQYLLATDRDNSLVSDSYNSLDPSVLRAIRMVVDAARRGSCDLLACGEMANSKFYIPILLGSGVDALSVHTASIESVARLIENLDIGEIADLIDSIAEVGDAAEIERTFLDHYRKNGIDAYSGILS